MISVLRTVFILVGLGGGVAAAEKPIEPAAAEYFESKVRPVLVEHCYKCHSDKAEKVKGGLYLDTREGVLKGGDTGPAVVPGDPEKSLLIKAVRYSSEDLQMPPKGKKLSPEQIADLEAWVRMGAPDPRTGENRQLARAEDKTKSHWSFQPVRKPVPPLVSKPNWTRNAIDNFVFARLEQEGMKPSAPADKRTLLRRASFDLIGLPPSAAEVEAFERDNSEKAWENAIDRLLASPLYGECWARHWLDVARYADTKGYVFEEERRYAYAYTYRDYVIRAFNQDLPFNEFIIEQIAADQLPLGEDKRALAAMGYLTLGRRFLNNQADIIDDRIDVVTRGFMGLTVACARCHDHKYDPIPTKDYYSLYGVFASSSEPSEKPLLGSASLPAEYPAYEKERKKRLEELAAFREEKYEQVRTELRTNAAEYMLAAFDAGKLEDKDKVETLAKERKLHPIAVQRWIRFFEERGKKESDPIFAPWFAFAAVTNFSTEAKDLAAHFHLNETSNPVNPLVAAAFADGSINGMKEVAARYRKVFEKMESSWKGAQKEKKERLENKDEEAIREVLYGSDAPTRVSDAEIPRLFDVPTGQKNRALQRKLEELDAVHPGSPPRGMVLQDNTTPYQPHVFVRGNQFNPGEEVPRQFLGLIAGPERKPFQHGSGRLELAQAIASPENPLTARVIVNRVWLSHFGAGLVTTPSDFGMRADPPSHPELLDYLAAWFMDEGWSLKKLHKLILLSNTYQQSSEENTAYAEKDPNNRLLWKMNRRRLEFEPFRDTVLQVADHLDLRQRGQPVEITARPFPTRRTVYAFIERQNLPGVFRTFDFASPDISSPQRFNTTVPQQALFMMNSPFVVEQARVLAKDAAMPGSDDPRAVIVQLYKRVFQREPREEEITLGVRFVEEQKKVPPPQPELEVWQYGYGTVTEDHRLTNFQALPHFTGRAWQGGEKLPDAKLGWLTLNATGGHPGEGVDHAVVRRWIAPEDCSISISGTLEHANDSGNGVRGYIISNRSGALGFWPVYKAKRAMSIPKLEVKKGDTIDFVVDSFGDLDSDSFNWAPSIQVLSSGATTAQTAWRAKEDFRGPKEPIVPLNPWEKYAQVLLMSNELAFVD